MLDTSIYPVDDEDEFGDDTVGDDWDDLDDEHDEYDEYKYGKYEEDESMGEYLVRLAAEIEAGSAALPPNWKLDRSHPGILVYAVSGRRYAFSLTGESVPLPE
jgi:hypothetical protein